MTGCGWSGSPVRACGSIGRAGRLAGRAPPGDPLLRGRSLLAEQDRRCRSGGTACPRRPKTQWSRPRRGSPVVFCSGWCRLARISARARSTSAGQVRRRRRPGSRGGRRGGTATRPCRGCRCRPGCAGRAARRRSARRGRSRSRRSASSRSQSGPRTSGPEVADQPVLLGGGDHVDVVQPVADALPVVGGQDHPDVVGGAAVPLRRRAGRCASCRPSGSGCAACGRRPSRISRCLPRGTTSRTVRRSGRGWPAAGCGTRPGAACAPASAVFIRWAASQTVSPSGTASSVPVRGRLPGVSPLTTGMTAAARGAAASRERSPATARPVRRRRAGPAGRAGHRDRGPGRAPRPAGGLRAVGRGRAARWPRASPATSAPRCCTRARTAPSTTWSTASWTTSRWPPGSGRRSGASALAHVEQMVDDERYAPRRRASRASSPGRRSPGPRWRMTVLTIAAVFAITSLLQQFVMPHLAAGRWRLRLLLSAVVVVLLLGNVRHAGADPAVRPLAAPGPRREPSPPPLLECPRAPGSAGPPERDEHPGRTQVRRAGAGRAGSRRSRPPGARPTAASTRAPIAPSAFCTTIRPERARPTPRWTAPSPPP